MTEAPPRHAGRLVALVVLGVVVAGLLCLEADFAPPYEGDVFDYGDVAINVLHHGELQERHLRYYNIPDQESPTHPAGQRANYYSLFLVPFAAIFGESSWTVFLPGLLGVLGIAWMLFLVGRDQFDFRTGWWAAVFGLLNPVLLVHAMREGTPESWGAAFCLASMWSLLRKRYLLSGALIGVGMFVKPSVVTLLPAYLLYFLFFDRREFRKIGLWLGVAACIATASPFLVRNAVVFGNPLYSDDLSMRGRVGQAVVTSGNVLQHLFEPVDPAIDVQPTDRGAQFLHVWTSKLRENGRHYLVGWNFLGYSPGYPLIVGLALLPLILAGVVLGRKRPAVRLIALCLFVFLAIHILFVTGYEPRFVQPALAFGLLLAVHGAMELGRACRRLQPDALLAFGLTVGSLASLPFLILNATGRQQGEAAHEYIAACRYLGTTAPAGSTVMAWPPFSAAFFSGLQAVPYPYGDESVLVDTLRRYEVDYVLFDNLVGDDEFPDLEYFEPVSKGTFVSLFRVGPTTGVRAVPGSGLPDDPGFNPLATFFRITTAFGIDGPEWPVEIRLARTLDSPLLAAGAMVLAFLLFVALFSQKGWLPKVLAVVALLAFGFIAKIPREGGGQPTGTEGIGAPFNRAQLREAVRGTERPVVLFGDADGFPDYARTLGTMFDDVPVGTDLADLDPQAAILIPVPERAGALTSPEQVAAWVADSPSREASRREWEDLVASTGRTPVRIGGGIVGVPALPAR